MWTTHDGVLERGCVGQLVLAGVWAYFLDTSCCSNDLFFRFQDISPPMLLHSVRIGGLSTDHVRISVLD